MNKIKFTLVGILLVVALDLRAEPIFSIIPTTTSVTVRSDSSIKIPYTVTNRSIMKVSDMTVALPTNVSVSSNTCATLDSGASCHFNVVIAGTNQPSSSFTLSPIVCAFKKTACSQPLANQRLAVKINPIAQAAVAFVGLTNNTVLPITLISGSPGILGNPITGFSLSEPAGIAVNHIGTRVVVTDSGSNTLFLIDKQSNQIINQFSVGNVPAAVAFSQDDAKLYVANYNNGQFNGTISVLNANTGALLAAVPVGNGPWGLSVAPDDSKVYVTNSYDNTVSVIETSGYSTLRAIPVGTTPLGIEATPDGSKIYVANTANNTVSVIDASTLTLSQTIGVGNIPKGIAISSDSEQVYVTNWQDGTLSVIATATNQVIQTLSLAAGTPVGVALSPDGTQLYVTSDQASGVAVIQLATNIVNYIPTRTPQLSMGHFIG